MNRMIYYSAKEWLVDVSNTMMALGLALLSLLFVVLSPFVSLVWIAWCKIKAFIDREPIAFAIVFALVMSMSYGWLGTYVHLRKQVVATQHRLDSISYKTSVRLAK